jgi:hypothetical protein
MCSTFLISGSGLKNKFWTLVFSGFTKITERSFQGSAEAVFPKRVSVSDADLGGVREFGRRVCFFSVSFWLKRLLVSSPCKKVQSIIDNVTVYPLKSVIMSLSIV